MVGVEEQVVNTNHVEVGGAVEMTEQSGTLHPIRLTLCCALCSGVGMDYPQLGPMKLRCYEPDLMRQGCLLAVGP